MGDRLRIGTRKSAMALAQTGEVARRLTATVSGLDVEVVKFDTTGDVDQTSKLLPHGGKGGAFVAQIRAAVARMPSAKHTNGKPLQRNGRSEPPGFRSSRPKPTLCL